MYLLIIILCIAQTYTFGQTFHQPYTIGPASFDTAHNILFFGSAQSLATDGEYALTCLKNLGEPIPIAHKTVTLNQKEGQKNPVYSSAVSLLTVSHGHPALVITQDPTTLYLMTEPKWWSAQPNDAQGKLTSGIVSLTGSVRTTSDPNDRLGLFVAVKPANGAFGDPGSGIAFALLGTNGLEFYDTTAAHTPKNRATPYDRTLQAIAGATPLNSLGAPQLCSYYGILFIGAAMQTGSESTATLRSLCTATEANMQFMCMPIVPESAIGNDGILTAVGANQEAHVYALNVMELSTGPRYLIMAGGIGDATATSTTVYALPLVTSSSVLIASSQSPLKAFGISPGIGTAGGRTLFTFTTPAEKPADMPQKTDPATQVGAGPTPGPVSSLFTMGDAVFASVSTGMQAGVFRSQAIIDGQGKVVGWTPWAPACTATQATSALGLNPLTAMSFFVSPPSTITRTYLNQQTPLADVINTPFPTDISGVQGLHDIPQGSPALTSDFSLISATGYQHVVLAKSLPQTPFKRIYTNTKGTLAGFTPGADALVLSGGDLAPLGAIRSTALVTDGTFGWFVVGGNGGLAVLCKADGSGWLASPGLGVGFTGLDSSFSWRHVGNYHNVRAVIAYEQNLFIVTPQGIDRVTPSARLWVKPRQWRPVTVVSAGPQEIISDALISGPLCIVASSTGWWRNASGTHIQTALVSPQRVPLPLVDGTAGVVRLWSTNTLSGNQHLMAGAGSNIFALAGSVSHNQGYVFRAYVAPGSTVTDTTITPLPDIYSTSAPSFWFNVGLYGNFLATDGATTWVTRSAYRSIQAFINAQIPLILYPQIERNQNINFRTYTLEFTNTDASAFGPCIYRSATGSWLLATNRGIYECA